MKYFDIVRKAEYTELLMKSIEGGSIRRRAGRAAKVTLTAALCLTPQFAPEIQAAASSPGVTNHIDKIKQSGAREADRVERNWQAVEDFVSGLVIFDPKRR